MATRQKSKAPMLTTKELASQLRKHPSYVYAMRARGFRMPGDVATVPEARRWLARNPHPRARPTSQKSNRS